MYELHSDSKWTVAAKLLGFAAVVLLFSAAYFFFYTKVLCLDLPKTARLKKENAQWVAKFKMLDHEMDLVEATLDGIEKRDDDVYRSIFGLNEISQDFKNTGFGGANKYAYLDELGGSVMLKNTVRRMDMLTKRSYVQSKALDEVSLVSKHADKLTSCMPSVPPIVPAPGTYRI